MENVFGLFQAVVVVVVETLKLRVRRVETMSQLYEGERETDIEKRE